MNRFLAASTLLFINSAYATNVATPEKPTTDKNNLEQTVKTNASPSSTSSTGPVTISTPVVSSTGPIRNSNRSSVDIVDTSSTNTTSSAASLSNATAGANSNSNSALSSVSSNSSQSGDVSVGDVGGGSAAGGSINSRSNMWVFPAPVFSIPPTLSCGKGVGKSVAIGIGWNFVSYASSSNSGENCLIADLYNAKVASCQFYDAKQIEDQLLQRLVQGYTPGVNTEVNLTRDQCNILKAPLKPPSEPVNMVSQTLIPREPLTIVINNNAENRTEVEQPLVAPRRAPKTRITFPRCPEGQKLVEVCKPDTTK
jgi:hypothetical protein